MSDLKVVGGIPLTGEITPSGNKNAVLPILCATLLTDQKVVLKNVPEITDIEKLISFLTQIGSEITWDKKNAKIEVCHKNVSSLKDGVPFPSGMRSSVLLLASLLNRTKKITFPSDSKGCALGIREIDPHLEILEQFGAKIEQKSSIEITLKDKFQGVRFWQDYMSVTATENFVMAAVCAKGESKIINAASEPHVQDLCHFLNSIGAKIEGIGSSVLKITGTDELSGGENIISSDHHEVTTFLAIGAMTGGEVIVNQVNSNHFDLISRSFYKLGVDLEFTKDDKAIVRKNQELKIREPFTSNLLAKIEAAPWPYFPVDLLPPMVALATKAKGNIHFWNKVYEGGFYWIQELVKFGAHIVTSDPHRIIVFGNKPLHAAEVEAPYIIRAAVALYMVAASLEGESTIRHAHSIKRAHPHFVENLNALGANVNWID